MRVLIAEDERRLAELIARGLRREGMAVDLAPDGAEALIKARVVRYDVLVLDRDLPDRPRRRGVPRGARGAARDRDPDADRRGGALEDLVEGLALGADDYLRQAVPVRRARRPDPGPGPSLGSRAARRSSATRDLELDPGARRLTRAGRQVDLARKEFAVLEAADGASGRRRLGRGAAEAVWDEQIDPFTNVVRMTIMTLRRKLGEPQPIETVIGVGYRMA